MELTGGVPGYTELVFHQELVCTAICDGSTPTFLLTIEMPRIQLSTRLRLKCLGHSQTHQIVERYGHTDRGCVAPSLRPDMILVNCESLNIDMSSNISTFEILMKKGDSELVDLPLKVRTTDLPKQLGCSYG